MMQKQYQSALGITVGFLILYLVFDNPWLLYTALAVGLLSLLSSTIAYWIHWAWMKLVSVIGLINSYIILGLVFLFILFPLSVFYRLFNKDVLQTKEKQDSYFIDVSKTYTPKDLENPW